MTEEVEIERETHIELPSFTDEDIQELRKDLESERSRYVEPIELTVQDGTLKLTFRTKIAPNTWMNILLRLLHVGVELKDAGLAVNKAFFLNEDKRPVFCWVLLIWGDFTEALPAIMGVHLPPLPPPSRKKQAPMAAVVSAPAKKPVKPVEKTASILQKPYKHMTESELEALEFRDLPKEGVALTPKTRGNQLTRKRMGAVVGGVPTIYFDIPLPHIRKARYMTKTMKDKGKGACVELCAEERSTNDIDRDLGD